MKNLIIILAVTILVLATASELVGQAPAGVVPQAGRAQRVILPPEHVSFLTQDGWTIYADLYGTGDRGVVLVHGGLLTRESWEQQARELVSVGFRVLAIDLRGFGQSKTGPQGQTPDEGKRFDVLAAIRYLRKSSSKPVAIVGASMGGDAAAEASAEAEPGEIDRLVLLGSAGGDKPEQIKGRKLFIVARGDHRGNGELRLPRIRQNYEKAASPKKLVILDGTAHAQFIFATRQRDRLQREIQRFLSAP